MNEGLRVRRMRLFALAPFILLAFAAFAALVTWIVMRLWNWLLPPMFGWHALTFWQALAMLALCRILFGGFGMHGGPRSGMRRRMAERWERMTPDERERMRQSWRGRWFGTPGGGGAAV
jgi:hypothetical protein